jgi:HAD superfamily hydrolase (TIGR01509 family)
MPLRAVVFDLDGVLIDSEICWQRAREAFAADHGRIWTEALQHQAMGTSTDHWLGLMQRHTAPETDVASIYDDVLARMRAEYTRRLPLREGAVATVRTLAHDHPIALASGAPTPLIDHAMDASGLGELMRVIVYGDTIARGKPAPDIYLEAVRRLGVAPDEAVGVEDSPNGLAALNAAGLWAVAAPAPGFELSAEVLARAHDRIDRLAELTPERIASLGGPTAGRG